MNAPVTRIRSERLLSSCRPAFERRYLGSEPFVLSGVISTPEFCFGWSHFEVLLASAEPEALLVAGAGADAPAPCEEAALQTGVGLVIRDAERFCPVLRSFAQSVHEQLGACGVQLSATAHLCGTTNRVRSGGPLSRVLDQAQRALADTPPQSGTRRAFEMCTDRSRREDAWVRSEGPGFFVQSQGESEHFFRPNTVALDPRLPGDDLDAYRYETSRLWMAKLSEGDVLYLPRGWWHRHQTSSDSLSLVMTALRERASYGMIVA